MDQLQLEDVNVQEVEQNTDRNEEVKKLVSPADLLPTPPPSEEASPTKEGLAVPEEQELIGMLV